MIKKLKSGLLYFALFLSLQSVAANYYWVGGTGNWSDINHWAISSGSGSLRTVVPGPSDDVFFDVNSGFTASTHTITLDVIAICHNMTWNGALNNPNLTFGSQYTINIYGSVVLQSSVLFNVPIINMLSASTESITCNGGTFGSPTFNGTGSWSFQDAFLSSGINILQGTINTNNFAITSNNITDGNSTLAHTFNGGSSIINAAWTYTATTGVLNLSAGSVINGVGFYTKANDWYYDNRVLNVFCC